MPAISLRAEKIDIRTTKEVKSVLKRAAEASHTSLSHFVLDTALSRAREVLEEQSVILNDKQWKAFIAALDAPPRSHARMKRMLKEPSILE